MKTLYYEFGNDEFEYQISYDEYLKYAIKYVAKTSEVSIESVKKLYMKDFLNLDDLDDFDDGLVEYLKEEFYAEAYENYRDSCAEAKDPYGYRGISENDFH